MEKNTGRRWCTEHAQELTFGHQVPLLQPSYITWDYLIFWVYSTANQTRLYATMRDIGFVQCGVVCFLVVCDDRSHRGVLPNNSLFGLPLNLQIWFSRSLFMVSCVLNAILCWKHKNAFDWMLKIFKKLISLTVSRTVVAMPPVYV